MRFILGVLVGYSIRGHEKRLITVLAAIAFIVYIVLPATALLALSIDVHHERRSRPVLTRVPVIEGLSYDDAEAKLRASKLKIRLLATRYDLPIQPGLVIDQVPEPGEEVVYGYPVGVTITKAESMALVRNGKALQIRRQRPVIVANEVSNCHASRVKGQILYLVVRSWSSAAQLLKNRAGAVHTGKPLEH